MAALRLNVNKLSRFRGALVGAVIGDCLGAPFEVEWDVVVKRVIKFFTELPTTYKDRPGQCYFTDDTAMARSVAASLIDAQNVAGIEQQSFVNNLARRFVEAYNKESGRGYGGNIANVFHSLEEEKFADVFGPAGKQFGGSGSYGNGGAMRIVPAALFGYHLSNEKLCRLVSDITCITHSNRDAINGAVLQCTAVQQSLQSERHTEGDPNSVQEFRDSFVGNLLEKMQQIEKSSKKDLPESTEGMPYCSKLRKIQTFLKSTDEVKRSQIVEELGNNISALGSVPAAIYSFLHCTKPVTDIPDEYNGFARTIIYAVTLGGDTDTIATMAGAIAGAYYGIDAVPQQWKDACEGVDFADDCATKLHDLIFKESQL